MIKNVNSITYDIEIYIFVNKNKLQEGGFLFVTFSGSSAIKFEAHEGKMALTLYPFKLSAASTIYPKIV